MPLTALSHLLSSKRQQSYPVAYCKHGTTTWAQFQHDVSSLTFFFQHSEEKRWALAFDSSYLFATAFLALCHANKDIILPGNLQPAALDELCPHFDAIIHDKRISPPTHRIAISLPMDDASLKPQAAELQPFKDISLTLFTSGSSSTPKAIFKQLSQLQAELNQLEDQWGTLLANTAVHSTVSHQHIYGLLFRVLWPLSAGRPFFSHDLVYPEQITASAGSNITLISSPALLKRLEDQTTRGEYRAVFSSGGPLPYESASQSKAVLGQRPIEVYGSTETGGIGFREQHAETQPWTFFSDIQTKLDDKGCLMVLSPYIKGNKWYKTADLCELICDSQFALKGRADRVVKVEEKRISLFEIEQRLCESQWISDATSIVLSVEERQVIAAAVTLSPQGKKEIEKIGKGTFQLSLRKQLRAWLEPIAIPRHFRFVDAIPQNSQGKRQEHVIRTLFTMESSRKKTTGQSC